ncbi:MAG: DegT/DnrJ/EryC1/StrS family aminotransferase [Pseudomonadota bacterium]|nr:DegT/DnrJ/EryC1/StrS family aminotransferase [Pseudomonadota bacterium]
MQANRRYPLATDSWDEAEFKAIDRVIASRQFTMGAEVRGFEDEAAQWFGARHAVMVNSGSSANLLAIAGLMYHPDRLLMPGDEVIVPAVSWSTTYYPLHQNRLTLRFVDVDRDTLNLDLDILAAALTPRTRAIFAVNLLGNPVDLPRLSAFCDRHGLLLIEDNCESMGATIGGRKAGTWGICGTYSTFYSHHISTMEGGFILTDDKCLYEVLISLRAHGWVRGQPQDSHLSVPIDPFTQMFRFVLPGYNVRPLEMSGAIGREQLKKLAAIVEARRENADQFRYHCGGIKGVRLQKETGESSWFGFSLLLEGHLEGRRRKLIDAFEAAGVECRPIVAGNFLRNPVIDHLDHSVAGDTPTADAIDLNGVFIGNHHFAIGQDLEHVGKILREFSSI